MPEDGPPPENLSAVDRRIAAYVRAGLPAAEIAIREGMSIADARLRIARVTGTPPASPPPPPAGADPQRVPPAPAPAPALPEDEPRRLSRRAVLSIAAGGMAALAGGAFLATRPTRQLADAPAGASATVAPPASTPTPAPTADPSTRILAVRDAFERSTTSAGTEVEAREGMFFLDAESGAVERFTLSGGLVRDGETVAYSASADHAVVVAAVPRRTWIVHRERGLELTWPNDALAFIGAEGDYLILAAPPEDGGRDHYIYRLDGSPLAPSATFRLPGLLEQPHPAVFSPERQAVLLWTNGAEGARIVRVSLADGAIAGVFDVSETGTGHVRLSRSFDPLRASESPELRVVYRRPAPGPAPLEVVFSRIYRLSWDGSSSSGLPYPGAPALLDPAGELVAWQEWLHVDLGLPAQAAQLWPAVVVADAVTRHPRFRVLSAQLDYGSGTGNRWLGDSSGVLAHLRGPAGAPWFGVIRADGSGIDPLPAPAPPVPDGLGDAASFYAPAAPIESTARIAFGPTAVLDVASGAWRHAVIPPGLAPVGADPWGTRDDELAFTLAAAEAQRPLSLGLLPPSIEHAPFADAPPLTTAGPGATVTRAVNGEPAPLRPGDLLELWDTDAAARDSLRSVAPDAAPGSWAFVRAPDAAVGWVPVADLAWAPPGA